MTLVTMIAAPWGVWQCVDKRLTDLDTGEIYDNDSVKRVSMRCPDGRGVLTYTGIGALRDGRHLSEWVRDQLVGETRTLDQSLLHLRAEATRQLAQPLLRHNISHAFVMGAIFGDGGVWIAEITNVERWGDPVLPEFVTRARRIDGEGFVGMVGVRESVPPTDLATMQRLKDVRPNKTSDYRGLLAHINRRAAMRSDLVSDGCWTASLTPHEEGITCANFFDPPGKVKPAEFSHLLFGIDTTPMMRQFQQQFQRWRADPTFDLDSEEARAESEAAAREAVREKK